MHFVIILLLSLMDQLIKAEQITTYKIHDDSFVQGSILRSQPAVSAGHCGTLCTADASCGAANYNSTGGVCQLLAVDPSEVTMVNRTGSSYICCSCSGAISGTPGNDTYIFPAALAVGLYSQMSGSFMGPSRSVTSQSEFWQEIQIFGRKFK